MDNRATRLYMLFESARKNGERADRQTKALKVWSDTLEYPTNDLNELEKLSEVARQLSLIGEELHRLRTELRTQGYSETVFEECYHHCFNVINPVQLSQRWASSHASHLQGIVRTSFQNWGHVLGKEETPISNDELESVLEELTRFKGEVAESKKISDKLKNFLLEQIRIIVKAIRDYKIQGVWSFHSKGHDFKHHAAQKEDIFEAAEQEGGESRRKLKELGGYWQKVASWISHAETTTKYLKAAPEAFDKMTEFL